MPNGSHRVTNPTLELEARIVNRPPWYLHYFVSTVRAEDCRARLLFFTKGRKFVYHGIPCIWKSTGKESADISASFYPELLTLFKIDPLTRRIIVEGGFIPPLPSGDYELGLVLDAKGTSSAEIWLGRFNFPDDFLGRDEYKEEWRETLRDGGFAVFPEVGKDGKPRVHLIGKVPDSELAKLKNELKEYEFDLN